MMKLILCFVVFGCAAFGQAINIPIQADAIWALYNKPGFDKDTSCDAAVNGSDVYKFCSYLRSLAGPDHMQVTFAFYAVDTLTPRDPLHQSGIFSFLSSAADSRIDTQGGSSTSGTGTTSIAERSGISDVLGAALETGAVTQTISGSNLTLQANVLALYRFARGQNIFQYCPDNNRDCFGKFATFANMISGTATLSVSNTSTQTVTGTVAPSMSNSGITNHPTALALIRQLAATSNSPGTGQTSAAALIQNGPSHLTGFTVRFQPINTLDLRSKAYLDAWKSAFSDATVLQKAADLNNSPNFSTWYKPNGADGPWLDQVRDKLQAIVAKTAKKQDLEKALASAVVEAWKARLQTWQANGLNVDDLKKFLQAASAYMTARDAALEKIRKAQASGLTFEYSYSRPDNQPRISTARVIYSFHPGIVAKDMPSTSPNAGGQASPTVNVNRFKTSPATNDFAITFNFGADFYDSPPPSTGTLRDLQAAVQLDRHFGTTIGTIAGYYQYQNQPAALKIGAGNLAPNTNIVLPGAAATLLAPKGNIGVAQAMLTFALKNGTRVPLGITWSNRTELIKGNEVRGHIGFNFDWSSLLLGGQAKAANPSM